MKIVVIGGTGLVGSKLVRALSSRGHDAVAAAPSTGRAVAESAFHHFADYNWDVDCGAPSFVTEPPGTQIREDPSRLAIFKDYVRNVADWLHPGTRTDVNGGELTHASLS
ncbi:hypothetical protein MHEL_23350 [Mycolicibacterium helvum]|uniref:NAD-dependent epimerase/dehydratase domain-containing protein n=1 Tax=Mycolicibacterium helvum TaxID=1534349 RepID=A0A7I7T472_9MYCO|nr:hypothetical protein MHEL_23350 [Mycolicibacterium helvum]